MLFEQLTCCRNHETRFISKQNGNGKVDGDDVTVWWKKSQAIMKDSVPEAGGFSAGFLLGARRG